MILIVDFGSQTAHLIKRRVEEFGVKAILIHPENALNEISKTKPSGLIMSGGPSSVYEKGAPTLDKKIFQLGIPILGICYGQQLTAYLLPGGKTVKDKVREDGPATLTIDVNCLLFGGVPKKSKIWMSHGDTVIKLPVGFDLVAHSETISSAVMQNINKKIYGVQFHPEVEHTEFGNLILKNFLEKVCGLKTIKQIFQFEDTIKQIKE